MLPIDTPRLKRALARTRRRYAPLNWRLGALLMISLTAWSTSPDFEWLAQPANAQADPTESAINGSSAAIGGDAAANESGDPLNAESLSDPENLHWAAMPLRPISLPPIKDRSWVRNRIDHFVLHRLEQQGLSPAPQAEDLVLLRRVYLDVLGLPPGPERIIAYLQQDEAERYGKTLDMLFQSPHYGEQAALFWLDQARYADSHGYDMDQPRPHAWRFRHWVINAFNSNLPFDQFTHWQLAGDLIPNATLEQRVATGFHRNTLTNLEAGADPVEDRFKQTFDRTETTAKVWLATTLACARCHDHRYDPITQREYYQFFAFFNQLEEQEIVAPPADYLLEYEPKKAEFDKVHQPLLSLRAQMEKQVVTPRLREWERRFGKPQSVTWRPLEVVKADASMGEILVPQDDHSIRAEGPTVDSSTYTLILDTPSPRITAIRLEVLPDPSLPNQGPGRAPDGDFVLQSFDVRAASRPDPSGVPSIPRKLEIAHGAVSHAKPGWGIQTTIQGTSKTGGWSIGKKTGQRHVAIFEFLEPFESGDGIRLTIKMRQAGTRWFSTIGRFRISVTDTRPPFLNDDIANNIAAVLATSPAQRTDEDQQRLLKYYCLRDKDWRQISNTIAEHAQYAPDDPQQMKAQVLAERESARLTHRLDRGEFLAPQESVRPGVPTMYPPLQVDRGEATRLDLARWLTGPAAPVTARVFVNRTWQRYFGRGLVASEDDFGSHGDPPSHPALLDDLAYRFVQSGWDMKWLQREIVESATYRQSSAFRKDLVELDPDNVLLGRQSRRRLPAENIRDVALAASSALDRRIGGKSVVLPAPRNQDDLAFARSQRVDVSPPTDHHRRGLYIWRQRANPYPMLTIFDAPDGNTSCTRRRESLTPMQALTQLNNRVLFRAAQDTSVRLIGEIPENPDDHTVRDRRIYRLFLLVLSRLPDEEELQTMQELYDQHRGFYAQWNDLAIALARRQCVSPDASDEELQEMATWIVLARVLMNTDEFVTKE